MSRKTFVRSVLIAVLVAHPVQLWGQEAGKAGPGTAPAGTNTATVTVIIAGKKLNGTVNADGTFTMQMPDGTQTTFPAPNPKTISVTVETLAGAVTLNGTVNADGTLTVQMPDGTKTTVPGPDAKTASVTMTVNGMKLNGTLNADGSFTVQMPDGKNVTMPNQGTNTVSGTAMINGMTFPWTLNPDGSLMLQLPDGSKKTIQKAKAAGGNLPSKANGNEAPGDVKPGEQGETQRYRDEIAKDDCDYLNKKIEFLQDILRRRQEEAASLKKEVEDASKTWAEITMKIESTEIMIRQAQEDGDEKFRGQLQDIEKGFLNTRTSVVERQDKARKRIAEIEVTDYETIRKQNIEYTKQLEDCKKKQVKVAKDDCDGLKEKIRTLQDSLRKRQAEPATPKEELETIRKQIDDLLDRLANCPKQEPIDAQFDCLKSKFPGIQRSSDKKDAASDPTSKREFAWDNDKQAWIDNETKESICPPSGIDPCLVGTWECISFKQANQFITGGGTGFRVTFKSDGSEIVDYSNMQPIRAGDDKMVYEGKATARISAKDGVAKIEKMIDAGAKFNASFMVKKFGKEWNPKIPDLGPGGLGTTKGKSNYKCTGDSLEYQSSTPRGDADCTVKLTKVKP